MIPGKDDMELLINLMRFFKELLLPWSRVQPLL